MRALAKIRRAQIRIRIARSKLESLNDIEGAVRLEALNEILERIALRLETILILGVVSSELLRVLTTTKVAVESLKQYAPPDIGHVVMEIQQVIGKICNSMNLVGLTDHDINVDKAEEVENFIREAMEIARRRVTRS